MMFASFRLAMTWVHTWFGLVLGYVLMVAFFFGSLSVFAEEIDRWSSPVLRQPPGEYPSFDRQLLPAARELLRDPELPPGARVTYIGAYGSGSDALVHLQAAFEVPSAVAEHDEGTRAVIFNGRTGRALEGDRSHLGSGFFFPLHFNVTSHWGSDLGLWLVGASGFIMLIAVVSGVVIHRKLFREFFTFRPNKLGQRRVLDLHNLTGVAALPFHFFFAFTGVLIFSAEYFPGQSLVLGEHDTQEREPSHTADASLPSAAVTLASVDGMAREAQRRWSAMGWPARVRGIEVHQPESAGATVVIVPQHRARLGGALPFLTFSGTSGGLLRQSEPLGPIAATKDYLERVHVAHFEHESLRWLFFFGGLIGCVCIATGFIFFVGKRRQRHAAQGRWGASLADALGVASVTGMLIATGALMLSNRLLPAVWGEPWEIRTFWCAWSLSLVHALARAGAVRAGTLTRAWREQCWALALLCTAAAVANWITTGDHLFATLGERYWPVACVDLTLLATAVMAALAARRLGQREVALSGGVRVAVEQADGG